MTPSSPPRVALLAEGLPGDLRPLCYGRSTWEVPFLGSSLLQHALKWLADEKYTHVYLLDDTPGQWLQALLGKTDRGDLEVRKVDARRQDFMPALPRGAGRVFVLKPFAVYEALVHHLEEFHEQHAAHATFALVRLDPSALQWPFIPSCRMDVSGRILDVEKLRRTDALGSANLDNVHKIGFTSRSREFWAPRNLAILDADLVASLPMGELVAPLAGLARSLAEKGVPCFGRALRGRWWSLSTPAQVMTANMEAMALAGDTRPKVEEMPSEAPEAYRKVVEGDKTIQLKRPINLKKMAKPDISPQATVDDESYVGRGAVISAGAQVLGRCLVGDMTMLEEGAMVVSSILDEGCRVEADCCVEQSLIGRGSVVPNGSSLKHAVMASGEIQNIHRGVPPGGHFLDGLRTVSESAVRGYWMQHAPLPQRKPIQSLETLAKGLDNNVYHIHDGVRNYVIKRRLDCNAHPLLREYHILRLLDGMGIAPRPYLVDLRPEIELAPCIIMEYMQGERLKLGSITPPIAHMIGRTCAKVHSISIDVMTRDLPEIADSAYPDLRSYAQDVVYQYHSYLDSRKKQGLGEDRLSQEMRKLLDYTNQLAERENAHWKDGVPKVLCQGDLREFNMVLRHEHVSLLDWERCGVDDPAYDIGWFLALSRLPADAEASLREGYGNGLPGDDTLWQRVHAYRIIDIVTWPMHLIQVVRTYSDGNADAASDGKPTGAMYENDAYEALARAFNILTSNGQSADGTYTAGSVRELGPLFATVNN